MAKDKKKQDESPDSSKMWSILSLAAALAGAQVARRGLNTGWKAATKKNPPANPADPDVAFREAMVWAAASGAVVQIARMLATRRAAHYYTRSTGHLPPGLQPDDQSTKAPTPQS